MTNILHNFLEPTFADSPYVDLEPSTGLTVVSMVTGTVLAIAGIALAYHLWVRKIEAPRALRARLGGPYRFFSHKWYFDEAINFLVVRPFAWFGRFARNTFERLIVEGLLVNGTSGVVRAGSAAVRAIQSGFLRAYAALLLLGLAAVGLYFLLQSA